MEKIRLIIDNREQLPWGLSTDLFTVERGTLRTGDYSVRGLTDQIALERKTLGDCVNTVIHDWTRFRKELYRLAAIDHTAFVVEATVADILDKRYESDADPLSVLGRLNSIMLDHGVPVVFAGSRAVAETFAERWLIQAYKKCSHLLPPNGV